jgi:hypothetical protein
LNSSWVSHLLGQHGDPARLIHAQHPLLLAPRRRLQVHFNDLGELRQRLRFGPAHKIVECYRVPLSSQTPACRQNFRPRLHTFQHLENNVFPRKDRMQAARQQTAVEIDKCLAPRKHIVQTDAEERVRQNLCGRRRRVAAVEAVAVLRRPEQQLVPIYLRLPVDARSRRSSLSLL